MAINFSINCRALGEGPSPGLDRKATREGRGARDLEESAAIKHLNVYFTPHFIPMDLKPATAITTVVTINVSSSVMSCRERFETE